jgi:uncharacterized protein (DUF2147 family)
MNRILTTGALMLAAAAAPSLASAQGVLDGHWSNPKGSVIVKLAPCGDSYCGTVVKASAKAKASASKGGTPHLIGTRILSGMHPDGNGSFKGEVFDPKHNLHAPATIRLLDGDTLVVKGCVLAFVCKEQRWTRVS